MRSCSRPRARPGGATGSGCTARSCCRPTYRGELYDIGFDKPEAHVVEKSGRLYFAFHAKHWDGLIELRGLAPGTHSLRDYANDRALGRVAAANPRLHVRFDRHLLLEATPVPA